MIYPRPWLQSSPLREGTGVSAAEALSGFAAVRGPGQLGGWPLPPREAAHTGAASPRPATPVLSARAGVSLHIRPACPADAFHRAELRPAGAGLENAGTPGCLAPASEARRPWAASPRARRGPRGSVPWEGHTALSPRPAPCHPFLLAPRWPSLGFRKGPR